MKTALAVALFVSLAGCHNQPAPKTPASATATAPAATPVADATQYTRQLSTGYSVVGNLRGIEAQLVAFIEDASRAVDKDTWFNFDRLNFKFGSSELEMANSSAQLTNIAEIMKAFPAVKLKVGGYTDSVGKADANMKLSAARAKTVSDALVAMGVGADRLVPEGYGADHPECPANDTEECRAKNRRIAVRVTAK